MKVIQKFRKSGQTYYVLVKENGDQVVVQGMKNVLKAMEQHK